MFSLVNPTFSKEIHKSSFETVKRTSLATVCPQLFKNTNKHKAKNVFFIMLFLLPAQFCSHFFVSNSSFKGMSLSFGFFNQCLGISSILRRSKICLPSCIYIWESIFLKVIEEISIFRYEVL